MPCPFGASDTTSFPGEEKLSVGSNAGGFFLCIGRAARYRGQT